MKKLFEFATVHFCAIGEIVSDRLREDLYSVGSVRALAEMHNQFVGFAGRVLLGPANDELLSFAIEVPLMKGGWIHRVKDLLEGLDFDLNQLIFGFHGHKGLSSKTLRGKEDHLGNGRAGPTTRPQFFC